MSPRIRRVIVWAVAIVFVAVGFLNSDQARDKVEADAKHDLIEFCKTNNHSTETLVGLIAFIQTNAPPVDLDTAPGFEAMPQSVQDYFLSLEEMLNSPSTDEDDIIRLTNQFVEENNLIVECEGVTDG